MKRCRVCCRLHTFLYGMIGLCLLLAVCLVREDALAADYGFKEQIFTTDDGLPTTATLAIAQTRDGFIWLGGYGGLARYDGNEFIAYGGSRISNVQDLAAAEDGTLWIASSDCGLVHYQSNEFTFYMDIQEDAPLDVAALDLSGDGRLYFASEKGVGYIDEADAICWIEDEQFAGAQFTDVVCGGTQVWCLTKTGEVYSCRDKVERLPLSLEGDVLRSMAYNKNDETFYLGSEKNRVICCDGSLTRVEEITVEGVDCINAFGYPEDGQVMVCSDDGVAIIEDGQVIPQQLKIKSSIEAILVDMDGNMWLASSRQGVLLVTKGRFKDVSLLAGLDPMIVNTIVYEAGRLYVGHDTGFIILDEKTYEVIEDENYDILQGLRVREIYLDSRGRMWVCTTGNGLFVRNADGTTWQQYSSVDYPVLASDKFRAVIETSLGIVAATDAGAYLIGEDSVELLAEGLTMRVLSLVEANGTIYAGTDGEGVYEIRDRRIDGQITRENGLSSMHVMRMCPCSGNKGLWMTTGNSLDYLLFDTGEVSHPEKSPAANVMDVMVMKDETLWILAGNGIFQTTEPAILKDESTMDYRHYSKKNGIPYDMTANAYSVIVDDHAYLCGTEGITWMKMDLSYGATGSYVMQIDEIKMDDDMVYVQGQEQVDIPASSHRMEISAHMATYSQENPTMFYYMEGFDDTVHYVPFNKLAPIVYTNIPGGDYVFHFGVYDPDASANGQEVTMAMHVAYEWYEKKNNQMLLAMLALFLVVLFNVGVITIRSRRQSRKLEQEFQQKEQEILKRRAYTDYLTELYNRNYLNNFGEDRVDDMTFPVHVITLDCNNLKLINDQYGHHKGDELLRTLAGLMQSYFPKENATLLRLGGDEFMILTEGLSGEAVRENVTALEKAAAAIRIGTIPITFCYGICGCETKAGYDLEMMAAQADEQMIRNKQLFHGQSISDGAIRDVYDGDTFTSVGRHIKNDALNNILYEAFSEASENVYIYVLDMNTGVSRWSRNCVDFFGLPAEYLMKAEEIWGTHVHPDDYHIYADDLGRVFSGESSRHDCQYRALNRFNEYVWVECKGTVIQGGNGRNIFAGMMTRLDNQSIYDPLTGLKTKNQFYNVLPGYERAVIMTLSTNDFRELIGTYGYEFGDKILVQVAKILTAQNKDYRVFRMNGAEFALIIPNGDEAETLESFKAIAGKVAVITLDNGVRIHLSCYGGAALFIRGEETVDSAIDKMEQALEAARQGQRGCCRFYSPEIFRGMERRRLLRKELKESIAEDFRGFEVYYQPIMDRSGQQLVGCEALLRWKSERIGDSCPEEFIPLLEESGDIIEVGRYVIETAMQEQHRLQQRYGDIFVSFNVSCQQFFVENFTEKLYNKALTYGVEPCRMIIELTESSRVQTPEILAEIFEKLQSYGFKIALDDFGTGCASLEMLRNLPSDCVKIGHSFVQNLKENPHNVDYAIIRSIQYLCHDLGQMVVVEGIENEVVADIVRTMDVTYLQGYFYSEPLPVEDFEKLVEENRK